MNSENKGDSKEKKMNQRGNFGKVILLIIYLVFVVFLFYILFIIGINPVIIVLLLICMSSIILGTFFRQKKKSIYSELYTDKKRNKIQRPPRKLELKIEADSETIPKKKFKDVNLNFKYRKSLINKCENCGMIITSYKKNCPTCGTAFELKDIIKKCKTCGMTIPKSVKKCPICGTRTA